MKKQYFLAAALFVSTITIAQTSPSFGIRAGLSSAGMRGEAIGSLSKVVDLADGMIKTGNHTGFFAGAYTTIPLSNSVAIEPAFYYTQKGYGLKGNLAFKAVSFLGVNANADLNAQYIDLPVLVKATIGGFQVFAGPQVSYLTKANFTTTAGVLGVNLLNKRLDVTEQFNRLDAGVTGGIGYQFQNGLNIMAAYDHGLSRVDANKSMNSYNRSFKVGLGYHF